MDVRFSAKAQNGYRLIKWISLFHMGGFFLYATALGMLAYRPGSNAPLVDLQWLRPALIALSVVIFFMAGNVRERILKPARLSSAVDQALVPGERLQQMVRATLISFLLCDIVALLGLAVFLAGGTMTESYLFVLLAGIFLVIHFPHRDQWQEWYSARARFR